MKKLFIGIQGKAVCLDKASGDILWSSKLKSSSSVTNVYYEDNQVFAYSGGHLFCLNAETGEIVWENGLSGFGFGACIIASENQSSAAAISNQIASQQAAASSTIVATSSSASSGSGT
ncbi:MAG: outer membrane protein assembly factor BamB [Paraglaciecola sp.]|jgi:outer membrane protein assembly factor BamB